MPVSLDSLLKNLLLLFLAVAGLYYAQGFLIPLTLGALLATLFLPLCRWLESKKVPRIAAALICLLLLLSFITAMGFVLSWQIARLTDDITLVKAKVIETAHFLEQYSHHTLGISNSEQSQILSHLQVTFARYAEALPGYMTHLFTGFVLTMVYIVLLLYYRTHLKHFLFRLSSGMERQEMETLITRATSVSQRYLTGLSKMIFCLWIMYGIGFSIFGVENAVFFAILCGLLEIVPFIGNFTGTTITVLVAAANGVGFPVLAGIVFTYGMVQFIQGWILEPLILGPHVKINPLATIIALVIGEILWGIPGIVLAIPMTAVLKIVCDQIPSLQPYGFLIGTIEDNKYSPLIGKIKGLLKRGRR